MRLWSLHPSHLDSKGLVALWREGLLARHVLHGKTQGYTAHPQLERFREAADPLAAIDVYLTSVVDEATRRGYAFDASKIDRSQTHETLPVTKGQLMFETEHLAKKLSIRDPERLASFLHPLSSHPLFTEIPGGIAPWERP